MARVKVCNLCGQHNPPDELFCVECGSSLADVSVVDPSLIQSAEESDDAAVERVDAQTDGQGRQDHPPAASARTARDIDPVEVGPCTLRFPWGRVPVDGVLGVGRESGFSPISGQLDSFTTVSRRHAVVGVPESHWVVKDLGSTNGTYLNGERLAAGETRAISNGDQIGFSRSLQVGVEIEAGGH